MVKFAQVVLGPAGSGKSTYCAALQQYCNDKRRALHVINLDPAAEDFKYDVSVDIRDLISVDDVGEEYLMGPNGALVFCMEFLLKNIEWLEDKLDAFIDNDYVAFDLPGQIELYTHFPFMKELIRRLQGWDFRIQALYFLDSQFMEDSAKFFGGCITALSAMIQLEVPHLNVISKMDLAKGLSKRKVEEYMNADVDSLINDLSERTGPRFLRLNAAMGSLLDEFGMVNFVPLDAGNEDSLATLLLSTDLALQYEDEIDQNVRIPDLEDEEDV